MRIQLIYIFFFITCDSQAQDLSLSQYKTINDQNGLPSSEVYDIVEDQKGYIWFATDRGVSRYNGVSHEIYNSRNGLKGDATYHLFKQADTSIVCVNNIGAFYKIKNGTVKELIPEDSIKKYIARTEFPFSFKQTPDSLFHIGTRFRSYIFDQKGKRIQSSSTRGDNSLHIEYKPNAPDVYCYFLRPSERSDINRIRVRLNEKVIDEQQISSHYSHRSFYPSVFGNYIAIPLEYSFLLVDRENRVQKVELKDRILSTHLTSKQVFICTENGLYIYNYTRQSLQLSEHLLFGISVSSVLQTANGKLWISTLESGVRCYDLQQAQQLGLETNNMNFSAFDYANGKVFTGSYRGFLAYDDFIFQNRAKRKIHSIDYVNGDCRIVDGNIYLSLSDYFIDKPITTKTGEKLFAWELVEYNDSIWVTMLSSKLVVFNHKLKKSLDTTYIKEGITDFLVHDEHLFVATDKQLQYYSFNNSRLIFKGAYRIQDLSHLFIFRNTLCGVTKDYRLFRLTSKNDIEWLNLPKSKEFSLITAVAASENAVHIGTNKGIYSWKPSTYWYKAELIGFEKVPNPISLKIIRDSLFFATKKHVYRKALNDIKVELPSIDLKWIRIDGKSFQANRIIHIAYNHRSIEIPLEFTNFSSNPIVFRYIIRNLSTDFVYTADPTIRLNSLPPGDYTVEVSASVDEVNFTPVQSVWISVDLPYWRKWPFIVGIIFVTLVLLYLFYKFRVNKLKKKHELQESITRLKAQALGSQLNPHMIFNVLNSIQGLVSEGEIEDANVYIARFSKFVRKSLHYMEVTHIPLSEEIEMTKQYIEIEKLRFGDDISFHVDELFASIVEINVPPLIIQPIIENAIKHGLMPSKLERKELHVRVLQDGKNRIIEVEDNGIGFIADFTQNIGMRVTENRIKLLNSRNELVIKSSMHPTIVQLFLINEN